MKIAICTPIYGDPRFGYTKSLADLLIYTAGRGAEFSYYPRRGSCVSVNRNSIAESALAWGADYLLWIDADQTFPPDSLDRLFKHQKPVIGCNIPRREEPTGPTVSLLVDGQLRGYYTTPELAAAGRVDEVSAMGFGLCLMTADAVRAVDAPRFDTITEDYAFCAKLRAAGVPMFVDHGLSWDVGHVTEKTLTMKDALADRVKWESEPRR